MRLEVEEGNEENRRDSKKRSKTEQERKRIKRKGTYL